MRNVVQSPSRNVVKLNGDRLKFQEFAFFLKLNIPLLREMLENIY